MIDFFIDTNILISYSKGFAEDLNLLLKLSKKNRVQLYINSIVIAEFFNDNNLLNNEKLIISEKFIQLFKIINLDKKIGLISGKILREKQVDNIGDALIAATCSINNLQLVTRNQKHFNKVKNLKIYKI